MNINWFPGHMRKTNKLLLENIKVVDICIEILDARIPISSRNPLVEEIIYQKPTLIILNKADLADENLLQKYEKLLKEEGHYVLSISANNPKIKNIVIKKCKEIFNRELKDGRRGIRTLITGIPNVGKSTLINTLLGKQRAKTGDRPAVTKDLQRIVINEGLELYDTPGILWHKFEDQELAFRLAITGSIRDEILNITDIALKALDYIRKYYKEEFLSRFKLDDIPSEDEDSDCIQLLEIVAKKRACLCKGGAIDWDKASSILLQEFRAGKICKFTLDR